MFVCQIEGRGYGQELLLKIIVKHRSELRVRLPWFGGRNPGGGGPGGGTKISVQA